MHAACSPSAAVAASGGGGRLQLLRDRTAQSPGRRDHVGARRQGVARGRE